jgi:hypothetical protein
MDLAHEEIDLYGFNGICKDLEGFVKICMDLYGFARISTYVY